MINIFTMAYRDFKYMKNYHDVLLGHIEKIQSLSATDFSGGEWVERTKLVGNMMETEQVWIPDKFMSYVNCILNFYAFLYPKLKDKDNSVFSMREKLNAKYELLIAFPSNEKRDNKTDIAISKMVAIK